MGCIPEKYIFPPHNLFSCSQTTFATMESISLHHTLLTMTLYLTTHRHRSNRSKPELVGAMDQNDPFFLEAVPLNLSRDEMCLIHKTGSEQCSCLCYHTHTLWKYFGKPLKVMCGRNLGTFEASWKKVRMLNQPSLKATH